MRRDYGGNRAIINVKKIISCVMAIMERQDVQETAKTNRLEIQTITERLHTFL